MLVLIFYLYIHLLISNQLLLLMYFLLKENVHYINLNLNLKLLIQRLCSSFDIKGNATLNIDQIKHILDSEHFSLNFFLLLFKDFFMFSHFDEEEHSA